MIGTLSAETEQELFAMSALQAKIPCIEKNTGNEHQDHKLITKYKKLFKKKTQYTLFELFVILSVATMCRHSCEAAKRLFNGKSAMCFFTTL